jgi:phospho-N-acetylmuramoyl-pentapeptide-transferase
MVFFILPAAAIYMIFLLLPIADSLRLSFYSGKGFIPAEFVGFGNYVKLFTEFPFKQRILNAFTNNMEFFIIVTIVQNIFGFFIAFGLTLFLMPKFIKWAQSKKHNQPIYDLAPKTHQAKFGTSTMGGIIFIFSTLIAVILTAKLNNYYVIGAIVVILLFSLIGIKDDMSKIVGEKNDSGLKPKTKMILQIVFSFIVSILLYYFSSIDHNLYIPFYKHPVLF